MKSDIKNKRGRPRSAFGIGSVYTNNETLAWEVSKKIEASVNDGQKITIKEACRLIMKKSVVDCLEDKTDGEKNRSLTRTGRRIQPDLDIDRLQKTYDEVRKILKKWKMDKK